MLSKINLRSISLNVTPESVTENPQTSLMNPVRFKPMILPLKSLVQTSSTASECALLKYQVPYNFSLVLNGKFYEFRTFHGG